jgi:hypothetical protein
MNNKSCRNQVDGKDDSLRGFTFSAYRFISHPSLAYVCQLCELIASKGYHMMVTADIPVKGIDR